MAIRYPTLREWDWTKIQPHKLSEWYRAPEKFGFYELGFLKNNEFVPMYGGRAAGKTLRGRLSKHFIESHNDEIFRNAARLWCRYKSCSTVEVASYVEALHIAAMEYPWNRRNEWAQHWALEMEEESRTNR